MRFIKQHTLLFVLCLSSLGSPMLSAQSTDEESLVSLEFTALNWDNKLIKELKYLSDQEVESIDIYYRGFTVPTEYKGTPQMTFFREKLNSNTGEMIRTPVGSVLMPDNANEVLLIFIRDPNREEEYYQITAINRDRADFPKGSYQIYNLSDYAIAGKVDDSTFQLAKRENSIIRLSRKETAAIEVKFARTDEDGWKLAYSSLWGHKVNKRVNIFICNSGDLVNPVKVRKFEETVKD